MKAKGCVFEQHRYWGPPGAVSPPVVTTPDDSRFGNHGTNTDITYTQLPSGLFVPVFNGTTSLINCGSGSALDDLKPLTYIAWIKPSSAGGGNEGRIFHKRTLTHNEKGVSLLMTAALRLVFCVDYVTTDLVWSVNAALKLGVFQQVAVTWTGSALSANVTIYKNAAIPTVDNAIDGVGARVSDAAYNQIIGNTPVAAFCFDGLIALVRIYNYVLNPDQVNRRFEAERRFFGV